MSKYLIFIYLHFFIVVIDICLSFIFYTYTYGGFRFGSPNVFFGLLLYGIIVFAIPQAFIYNNFIKKTTKSKFIIYCTVSTFLLRMIFRVFVIDGFSKSSVESNFFNVETITLTLSALIVSFFYTKTSFFRRDFIS